ncbi:ABC transporter ATP-binding protein [Alcaligenes endophyticus]|uniref:ATP-binding cassette domain-containing protein n=1 Tax=Alcaligenes endophyticus TaxID=1929088 RepID=A0ABT8EMF6_9BURK|nr:ATP-binding cassette domain-containing protein [Alcaligenes endophyticus]MCX5590960.1 ATP-binding cassette domain-containing protein [Alcaligenes endophyticus]MDN4122463.1 ATP-binding cassette domain-containing protein [Alcaligenes endophyticus]
MLTVQSLATHYGKVPVLFGVGLHVRAGELLGILGHNGMGKTTLLKTIMGFLPASQGSVTFQSIDITAWPCHQRARFGMAYVPQGRGIFPALSVRDNLRFAQAASGRKDCRQEEEILSLFPRLERLLTRRGGGLSGGEQQLLALARALVARPELLLLDEPTEGIQPSIIEEMIQTLSELRQQTGMSVLLVEQNLDFIRFLSDRVLIMSKGVIESEMLPDQISEDMFMGAN